MILLHGSDIIPLEQLSKLVQEAKNDEFQRVRESNTRKLSVQTMGANWSKIPVTKDFFYALCAVQYL